MKKLFDSAPAGRPYQHARPEKEAMDIAIIGMAGRVAEASDLDSFWEKLLNGQDLITEFPEKRRKDVLDYLEYLGVQQGAVFFKPASFLSQVDLFDHSFFNISHAEASAMSPEQRILLETIWHTLEDAGYAGKRIRGSRTAVYIGYARENNPYMEMVNRTAPETAGMAITGNIASVMAGRLAHFLDLKGPAMLVNTACSSSLVALHQACRAILGGDCEMALVGGINLFISPVQQIKTSTEGLGVASASGIARSFDDSSDGTGGGEGSMALLLKPLNKALQDNDRIHAVIKGSAINQDGRSINVASPNSVAQEEVITAAWKSAGIDPLTISYIETHGTGTPLGDPIEIAGLTAAFRHYTEKRQFCAIGALKSNIGHLDGAAGIAGVIKAVLSLKNKIIPPSLHFEKPNRHIPFEDSPLYMNTRVTPWDDRQGVRRCGVSSFGISGTNAHVVLEEAPPVDRRGNDEQEKLGLFVISGGSTAVLKALAGDLLGWLSSTPDGFEDICYASGAGRGHFSHRLALIAKNKGQLNEILKAWLEGSPEKFDGLIFEADLSGLKGNIAYEQQMREMTRQAAQWIITGLEKKYESSFFEKLASLYVGGADIDWDTVYRNEHRRMAQLPLYPFQPKRCWIETPVKKQVRAGGKRPPSEPQVFTPVITSVDEIFGHFRSYFSKSFDIPADSITRETNVYEIGLDSITIVQVRLLIKKSYGIDVQVIDIFRKYMKIGQLSEHIEQQLQLRSKDRQVDKAGAAGKQRIVYRPDPGKIGKPISTIRLSDNDGASEITPVQQRYLERFMHDYQARSAASLEYTRQHMPHFANNRNVSGFKKAYKQLHYTIFADRVNGSRIWDIDGNEYIDFAMGFGVFFMGHNHPLIKQAVEQQLSKGAWLGPLSCLTGEVAALISEITGVERVAFYNSGTEAVMVAIRLARAATGRNKIVTFTGSYHGMFDGLLAQRSGYSGHYETAPLANGILQSMVDEVYVLEYDDPAALDFIRQYSSDIAAVVVEPVQSRKPELQPREFLADLRNITAINDICLIFDEIITGFRILPGGAQQYFNVKADLVTYGKVAGGGLPLGIVAGTSAYMMGIDGGIWDPRGDTLPLFDHRRTLVAGTFCHHPLALASAKAILQYLKNEGMELYHRLNRMTTDFVLRLNNYFIEWEVPIRLYNFGSMLHFRSDLDLKLFFYHLICKGIYVWEGATFFISTAHSEEDLACFETAIRETIHDLRAVGMMPRTREKLLPLTNEQFKIWLRSQEGPASSALFNELIPYYFQGKLDEEALGKAIGELIGRHESLRIRSISADGQFIGREEDGLPAVNKIDAEKDSPENSYRYATECMKHEVRRPFLPGQGFIRSFLITYGKDKHIFGLVIHQLIADGYSLSMIQAELQQLYESHCRGEKHDLPVPERLGSYIHLVNDMPEENKHALLDFWSTEWKEAPPEPFIRDPFVKPKTYEQRWSNVVMPDSLYRDVKTLAKSSRTTPFVVLLAAHITTAGKLAGRKDILTGVPSVGQLMLDNPCLVGQCMQMIPFRWKIEEHRKEDLLEKVRDKLSLLQQHRNFAIKDILEYATSQGTPCNLPDTRIVLNMDPPVQHKNPVKEVTSLDFHTSEGMMAKYDLFINVVEVNKQLHFSFQYNSSLFTDSEIRYWAVTWFNLLHQWTNAQGCKWELPAWGGRLSIPALPDHAPKMLSSLPHEQVTFPVDASQGQEWISLDAEVYYGQLAVLSGRLSFPAGSNLWLVPGNLLPAEIANWQWMAIQQGWNLIISDTPPGHGDAGSNWVICGDRSTLTNMVSYPESFHWHCTEWVMVTSSPVSNLHLKGLPSLADELRIHIITRMSGSAWYIFHHFLVFHPVNEVQVIPAGQTLAPSFISLMDREGRSIPPFATGTLCLTDSKGKKVVTRYSCSCNGDGIFMIWSSGAGTIVYQGFALDEHFLLSPLLSHPQLLSAALQRTIQSDDPGTMTLEINYKEGLDYCLDPLDYLKIFFPKNLLPSGLSGSQHPPAITTAAFVEDTQQIPLLLSCVREVLKYPQATLKDSFIELGGSSIQAIHLVTMIRNRVGMEVNPAKLFLASSLEELLSQENREEGLPVVIPPAGTLEVYPLSYTQKRFWITEQLEEKVRTSTLVETRIVHGAIEERVFYTACLEVVNRHESLRTIFMQTGQEPVQKVLPSGKDIFDYRFEDWENEQEPEKKLHRLRDEEMQTNFQLDKQAAFRIRLLRLGPKRFATVLATHHIIFDGWSFDVLMRDIISAYKNVLRGDRPFPSPLSIQFRDYCVWHNRLITAQSDKFKRYREKKFGSYPRPLTLIKEERRPPFKQQEAEVIDLIVGRQTTSALRRIGRSQKATMFMVVHAALLSLLHYYAGETDITVGVPVAHRNHPDLQGLIGSLINTMAIRTSFKSRDSFLELLARVRMDAMEAFEHEEYPFDLLLSDINYPRDPSRNPLFDVGFTYHEKVYLSEMPGVKDLGIRSEEVPSNSHSVMADMWFNATLEQDHLTFSILYDRVVYNDAFMTGLKEDLHLILNTLSSHPGITLQELQIRCKARQLRSASQLKKDAYVKQQRMLQQLKGTAAHTK